MASVQGRWVTHRRFVPSIERAFRIIERAASMTISEGEVKHYNEIEWPAQYNPLSTEENISKGYQSSEVSTAANTVDQFDENVQASLMEMLVIAGTAVSTMVSSLTENKDTLAISKAPCLTLTEHQNNERGEIWFQVELTYSVVTRMPLNPPRIAQGELNEAEATPPAEIPNANVEPSYEVFAGGYSDPDGSPYGTGVKAVS